MVGEWCEVSIGEIAEVFDGPHATPPKTDSGPIFLGISNLADGRLDLSSTEHLSEEDYAHWTRRVTPKAGNVVFSYETRLGEAALIPSGLRCCLGRRMGLLRVRPGKVDSRFLLYAYLGPRFQETLRSRTIHGSTVDRIPLIDMPGFPMEVPEDIAEQRAIAHILGTLDDKIELNRRMNETLEAMARALFHSWFVDFDPVRAKAKRLDICLPKPIADLFPDGFEDSELGYIPAGWHVAVVGDEVQLVKGVSYRSEQLAPSHTALVTLKSINRGGGYRLDGLKEYTGDYKPEQVLSPGELVVAQTDVTQAAEVIGKPALVIPDKRFSVLVASLDLLIVRPKTNDLKQAFFYLMFRMPAFRDHVYAYTNGTTVLHLSKTGVPTFQFARPSEPLAHAFTDIVGVLFDRIIQNDMVSVTLAALRDALLPKLISGEIRVQDAEQFVTEGRI